MLGCQERQGSFREEQLTGRLAGYAYGVDNDGQIADEAGGQHGAVPSRGQCDNQLSVESATFTGLVGGGHRQVLPYGQRRHRDSLSRVTECRDTLCQLQKCLR